MARNSSWHIGIFHLLIFLYCVSNVTCTVKVLQQIHRFGVDVINSANEKIPKVSLKGLFGDISLENIAEYEAGLKTGDQHLSITELIKKYGYPVETHLVVTEDGYILTVFRIPGKGKSVFMGHGIILSADDWITSGPNISLAYLLADKGYDVWLGNARGNKHCLKHVNLTIDDDEFWDFDYDEIGRYDLPAIIDYALKITGKKKLIYIGYSQGTTAFLVLTSERPEYNNKVSCAIMLASVGWISHTTSMVFLLASSFAQQNTLVVKSLFGRAFLSNGTNNMRLKSIICDGSLIQNLMCLNTAFVVVGFDNAQINYKALSTILSHTPNSISSKQLVHYAQNIRSGKFRRYDYENKNLEIYGSVNPPDYPVDKIKVPMAFFHGESDWVVNKKDTEILMSHLTNNYTYHIVPYEGFGHLDVIYSRDARRLLYNDILDLINKHKTGN